MAIKSPDWLDACYMQKILRNAEKDESIEVTGITVKAATAQGDNYTSDMHRVTVELSRVQEGQRVEETESLIVKVTLQGNRTEELIEETGLFDTELSMMSVTLRRMTEMLQKVSTTSLSARCLYVQYEKPTHLVIEDLAPRGFRMADRQAGLDLDHCLLTLRNLGKFHAASIALKEKDPNALTKYKKGLLHKDQHPNMISLFNNGAKSCAEEVATWSELSPRIKEKLSKLSEVFFEKGCEAARHREDDFNVLNHGDLWINNMLFRYDDQQKPIEQIFVDFQLCHYDSPACDILYFFGSSTSYEIRRHHRDILLREYHASLTDTMAKLQCKTKRPTYDTLQESLKNRAFCEVFSSFAMLPGVMLEKGQNVDFNELLKADGNYVNPMYSGKSYRKILTQLLPWYDSKGLLDA